MEHGAALVIMSHSSVYRDGQGDPWSGRARKSDRQHVAGEANIVAVLE